MNGTKETDSAMAKPGDSHVSKEKEDDSLVFEDLPPFPDDVPTAPLLRVSLRRLLDGDQNEVDRFWEACCNLGFFYLDLQDAKSSLPSAGALNQKEQSDLTTNPWDSEDATGNTNGHPNYMNELDVEVDGNGLLQDANQLFALGKDFFDLPTEEKSQYDFSSRGSYYGYKGYGLGIIDMKGTTDRNELFNVSKDHILGITESFPQPAVLIEKKDLLSSYMRRAHAVATLLLRLLNARLDLPSEALSSKHRLNAQSGDHLRWVKSPPQPEDDRQTALGEHTDFGSVTVLFNRLGGLQVLLPGKDQKWCYVKPLKGHAVVNLGDAMVKFSAGILRSNIHRVVNPPGEQSSSTRMSLVYFSRPEDDVLLKPLDGSPLINQKKESGFGKDEIVQTSKEWIARRANNQREGGNYKNSRGTEATV